jgi:RHS repeat-associated protein
MFVGKEKDSESGLYYFGARYMDPGAGRFTSTDSVGPVDLLTGNVNEKYLEESQRLNVYVYGGNNPYRHIDLDGKIYAIFDAKMQRIYVYSNNRQTFLYDMEAGNQVDRKSLRDGSSGGQFPPGEFTLVVKGPNRGQSRIDTGEWFIEVLNVDNRSNMGIHGGGTSLGEEFAFEDMQKLTPTKGCIRIHNSDLKNLVTDIIADVDRGEGSKLLVLPAYPDTGGSQ